MLWKKLLIGLLAMGIVSGIVRGVVKKVKEGVVEGVEEVSRGEQMRQRVTEGLQRAWDGLSDSSLPKRVLADLEAIRANTERMVELLEANDAEEREEA